MDLLKIDEYDFKLCESCQDKVDDKFFSLLINETLTISIYLKCRGQRQPMLILPRLA